MVIKGWGNNVSNLVTVLGMEGVFVFRYVSARVDKASSMTKWFVWVCLCEMSRKVNYVLYQWLTSPHPCSSSWMGANRCSQVPKNMWRALTERDSNVSVPHGFEARPQLLKYTQVSFPLFSQSCRPSWKQKPGKTAALEHKVQNCINYEDELHPTWNTTSPPVAGFKTSVSMSSLGEENEKSAELRMLWSNSNYGWITKKVKWAL